MTVEAYAMKILAEHGCDCYTYGGESGETVLADLKEGYPEGMEFPYVDVANAIISISRVRPIKRSPYHMVWDTDNYTDGVDCDSLEQAKADAIDTLADWMAQARMEWKDVFSPTEEELDDYNYMICNFCVWVSKYDPHKDEYDEYWAPSYEDEEDIGWRELTMEDIEKEKAEAEGWFKEQ